MLAQPASLHSHPDDPAVKPGEVTFDVTNDGETVHNLEVEGPGEEAELPKESVYGYE